MKCKEISILAVNGIIWYKVVFVTRFILVLNWLNEVHQRTLMVQFSAANVCKGSIIETLIMSFSLSHT